jgi:hypothetical protein
LHTRLLAYSLTGGGLDAEPWDGGEVRPLFESVRSTLDQIKLCPLRELSYGPGLLLRRDIGMAGDTLEYLHHGIPLALQIEQGTGLGMIPCLHEALNKSRDETSGLSRALNFVRHVGSLS